MGKRFFGWIFCIFGIGCLIACHTPQRLSYAQSRDELSCRHPDRTGQNDHPYRPVVREEEKCCGRLTISRHWDTGTHIKHYDWGEVRIAASSRIVREHRGHVVLDFIVRLPRPLTEQDWMITLKPTLDCQGRLTALPPVRIKGWVHEHYYLRQNQSQVRRLEYGVWEQTQLQKRGNRFIPASEQSQAARQAMERLQNWHTIRQAACQGFRVDTVNGHRTWEYLYRQVYPVQQDDRVLKIYFEAMLENMGSDHFPLVACDTLVYVIGSLADLYNRSPKFRVEETDSVYTRQLSARLQFRQGQATLDLHQPSNRLHLDRIRRELSKLGHRDSLTLRRIVLTAACSPEGSRSLNERLGRARAQTVQRWLVANRVIPDDKFLINPLSENWVRLEQELPSLQLGHEAEILRLIRSENDLDRREQLLRQRYPDDYRRLYQELYPSLREVRLECSYTVQGLKSRRVTNCPDTVYAHALEWMQQRRYAQALEKLEPYRDYNTALCYLCLDRNHEAKSLLQQLPPSARGWYLMALACQRLGQDEEGALCLLRSYDLDPRLRERAGQDPEIKALIEKYHIK